MGGVSIDTKVACKWCYSTWEGGKFLLKVEPQNKKKLHKKCSPSTKYFNVMVFTCLVCQRKSKIPLAKGPKLKNCKKIKKTQIETEHILFQKEETKKVKKKKKKDKFCGLNPALFGNTPQCQVDSKTKGSSVLKDENPTYLTVNQQINNSINCIKKNKKKKKRSKMKKKQPSSVHTFINDC
ncbi:uncharacterized protein LOC106665629 isoform X2 [Cimex lectularius]|nr:uncharacterized protein LOC106665629 isoform X2 [Cimex lectularius]